MFLTDFHTRKYTGGIISWVGIFLTVTPAALDAACTNHHHYSPAVGEGHLHAA